MTETLSVLAAQRAEDQKLCDALRARKQVFPAQGSSYVQYDAEGKYVNSGSSIWDDGYRDINPNGVEAATRIEQLSQELAEASHDRDRYLADLERLRESSVQQPASQGDPT